MNKKLKIVLVTVIVVILFLFRYEIKYVLLEAIRYKPKSPGANEALKQVHPILRYKIGPMLRKAEEDGHIVKITSTHRTSVGNANVGGAKYSCHLVRMAVDLNIGDIKMASPRSKWLPYANIAKENGLRWGGEFSGYYDPVHFDIDQVSSCKEEILEEGNERLIFGKFKPIW